MNLKTGSIREERKKGHCLRSNNPLTGEEVEVNVFPGQECQECEEFDTLAYF